MGLVASGIVGARIRPKVTVNDLIGKELKISGLNLPQDRPSLLLVISSRCQYCRDSIPFYRDISQLIRGKVTLIAAFPEPKQESTDFLRNTGLRVDQILHVDPEVLGVRVTPTLIFLDSSGRVKNIWLGKLNMERQREVERSVLAEM